MFLGKSVRLIATVLLIAMACQITMAAGGSLESIYHTTSGERTTVILRGAATVPYVIHRVDDQTILIDLPGASANGLRPQYRVDSPAVESIEMEQVHTVSGESLTRMRVHLNTNCEVTPVVHDGLLTFNFMPRPKSYSPVPVSTSSASTGATVVTNVGAVMLTDSVVGFIDADGPVQYKHFATPDGKRVVVDIAGVHDVSTRKAVNVDGGVVKMVRVGQYSSVPPLVTRVVFEIAEPSAYTMQQDGNRLLVKFASTKPVVTAPPAPIAEVATQAGSQSQTSGTQSSSQTSSSQSSQTDDKKVPKLNRKTDDATKSDSNSAGTNPQQPTQQPSQITPPGTTPISGVSQEGASTVTNMKNGRTAAAGKDDSTGSGVKVTMDNPTLRPLPASRSNSVSTVNSQDSGSPDQTSGELKYGNPHFVGDPLSLNLNGVDIRQVTNLIAQQFGVNFIYDKSVGAVPVTVNNTEVPWNQVLDGLLKSQDLAATVEGPMVRILTSAKLIAEEEGKKRLKDSRLAALPLETKIVRLQYARADGSMAGASAGGGSATSGVSNSGSASPSGISGGGGSSMGSSGGFGGGMGGSGLRAIVSSRLSQRGKVEIDQRTNSLIITDVRENLDAALDMVAQLDRPERQVEIELRIVQANNDFQRDLGNQLASAAQNNHTNGAALFSTLSPVGTSSSTTTGTTGTTGTTTGPTTVGTVPGNFSGLSPLTNTLGAAAASSVLGLTTGFLGTSMISNVLTASEQQGKAKIISTPRITAQNNQLATVESGIQIPVQTISNNTVTTIYVSASLRLEITPMITDNGEVQLKIVAENNQPIFSQNVGGNPSISTQRAETFVRVPDGGTTIFGGVAVSTDSKTEFRTPGVAKLPVIGELFKRRQTEVKNDELLFFVTPRITKPQLSGLEDFLPPDSKDQKKDNPNPTKP